jgi:endonuclease/exonuclease/phosphatase family metal-dependent hydrolase
VNWVAGVATHPIAVAAAISLCSSCVPAVRLAVDSRSRPCATVAIAAGSAAQSPIAWLTPDRADERKRLDVWCATVGPAVIASASPAPPAVIDRLVVVTWNAHVGGGDLERLIDSVRAGRLTATDGERDFVLLVQEIFRSGPQIPDVSDKDLPVPHRIAPEPVAGARQDIQSVADRTGLYFYYVPAMRNGEAETADDREDRGNAILSTLPLANLTAIELPFERQRRVALAASLSANTTAGALWRLRLVNVHLDNRAGRRRLWLRSAAARARQMRALLGAIEPGDPILLAGDLNTWAWREPTRSMLKKRFRDLCARDRSPTLGRLRLDHMFGERVTVSSCRRGDDRFGSDHYPVIAVLSLAGDRRDQYQ